MTSTWTAWWKWVLVPLGASLSGAVVSAFFLFYGVLIFIVAAIALSILSLVVFLADLHGRVVALEDESMEEKVSYETPTGQEMERLKARLREQLEQIPELRKLKEPITGEARTKVINWHQRTLHLLDRVLGPHSGEYEDFMMNEYEPSIGGIFRGGGSPLQRGLDTAESILRAVLDVELAE